MRCDVCGKDDELFFIRMEGSADELALCRDCAAARGYAGADAITGAAFGSFLSMDGVENQDKHCPLCGWTARTLMEEGRLGCSACVVAFRRELGILWRRSGRPTRYTGKVPPGFGQNSQNARANDANRAAMLNAQLEQAVHDEDFEQAARIRDLLARATDGQT